MNMTADCVRVPVQLAETTVAIDLTGRPERPAMLTEVKLTDFEMGQNYAGEDRWLLHVTVNGTLVHLWDADGWEIHDPSTRMWASLAAILGVEESDEVDDATEFLCWIGEEFERSHSTAITEASVAVARATWDTLKNHI